MPRYLTEFIGTFFLVLTVGLAVPGSPEMAPLAIGAALMIMVYMGGHVSGGHYNPAVTLAVWLRGKLQASDVAPYMISQIAGALAAAFVAAFATGEAIAPAPGVRATLSAALLIEILYTCALALVVLNVATAKATAGNSFYGLAIGFTVVVAAFAGGPVSGGAFNPAVGIGLITSKVLSGGTGLEHLWLYIVGPLAGGALAAMLFRLQRQPG
jgi:aquaporin Z